MLPWKENHGQQIIDRSFERCLTNELPEEWISSVMPTAFHCDGATFQLPLVLKSLSDFPQSLCKSFNSFSFPTGYYNPNFFLQVDEQKGQLRRMKHTASYIREGENTQYCCNSEAILCSAAHVCQVWQITLKPGINLYSLNTTFPPLLHAEFQRISSREATRALSSFKHSHQITAKHEGLCKVPNKEGSNS